MLELTCPAQNYAWGRPADLSEVAQLAECNGTHIDRSKPFAELWMGTHPSGPAQIVGSDLTLKEWIAQNPGALGLTVRRKWQGDLPFLFKVLSVQTALSIQSHPDKKLAEQLHAANPEMYKDDNHKPEMALALTDFEALCGFVSLSELKTELEQQPELAACVGEAGCTAIHYSTEGDCRGALKLAFTNLMTCNADKVQTAVKDLVERLTREASEGRSLTAKESLVLRLAEQYPGDVGVLSAFFLNLVALKEGQAIYLAANEPHAYVSGQLVECMATSDNVIRAGLTPKFRDTEVLCSSLTYKQGLPEVLEGTRVHDHVKAYCPPFDEFEIQSVEVPVNESVTLPTNPGPMLMLIQKGQGTAKSQCPEKYPGLKAEGGVGRGSILFIPANTIISFSAAEEPLNVWVAACNRKVFVEAQTTAEPQQQLVSDQVLVAA